MRNRSTQRTLGAMLMAFEAFIVFFATLVAFGLKVADGPTVWTIGLTLAFMLILTPGILGRRFSYIWGTLLQVAIVALGIWLPLMYVIGGILICLWAWAMIAGSTIDRARRAYEKSQNLQEEIP